MFVHLILSMQEGYALFQIVYDAYHKPIDFSIVEINPVFEQMARIPKEILIGKGISHKAFKLENEWLQVFRRTAISGKPSSREGYYRFSNRYLQVFVFKPEPYLLAGLFIDVTDRRMAEIRLEEEKKRLSVTLKSIGDGVIATDVQGRIVFLNEVAQGLSGWTEEKAVGTKIEKLLSEMDYTNRDWAAKRKQIVSGKAVDMWDQTIVLNRNGKKRTLSNRTAPICNSSGEITGMVMVLRDVTEKRRAEQQIAYLGYHDKLTDLHNRAFVDSIFPQLDTKDQLPLSLILAEDRIYSAKLSNHDMAYHSILEGLEKKLFQRGVENQ
ncbi:MAG: PAS domain S-box protein [Bacillota bacterium]|nr:PAS domain S-box protein [Bacillota bacterium]